MSTETLPVNLLRQWAYCPRIPFIREVLGSRGEPPAWVSQGIAYDEIEHVLQRDRRLRTMGLESYEPHRRVSMTSTSLGLHGIADLLLKGTADIVVADYKLDQGPIRRGTRLQLGAYALLAEEHFGLPVRGLIVLFGKPVQAIAVAQIGGLAAEVKSAVAELRQVIDTGRMPATDAGPAKCGICEHLNFCNDRE